MEAQLPRRQIMLTFIRQDTWYRHEEYEYLGSSKNPNGIAWDTSWRDEDFDHLELFDVFRQLRVNYRPNIAISRKRLVS